MKRQKSTDAPEPVIMERKGNIEDLDRSFDLQFWQAQSDTARFAAAWELVRIAERLKGRDASQLRLQKSIETFGIIEAIMPGKTE